VVAADVQRSVRSWTAARRGDMAAASQHTSERSLAFGARTPWFAQRSWTTRCRPKAGASGSPLCWTELPFSLADQTALQQCLIATEPVFAKLRHHKVMSRSTQGTQGGASAGSKCSLTPRGGTGEMLVATVREMG
jgi:hypothetical protein